MLNETTKRYKRKIQDLEDRLRSQKIISNNSYDELRVTNEQLRLSEKLSDMKRAANQDYKDLLESQNVWLRNLVQDLVVDPEVIQAKVRAKIAINEDMRKNQGADARNSKVYNPNAQFMPVFDQHGIMKSSY